ncbi:MAG: hypothetical protein LBL49_02025 [Clostridiales Family XIII bacterium]|nr:hypothetical protein [Clostridiales Family XIII bacterium]
MRKKQQRQILELIETLGEALDELHKQSAEAVISDLLVECQEFAQAIGHHIESVTGVGTQAVALLEDYCGLLFKYSGGEVNENTLRKHLFKIKSCVKSELKADRLEVVFLSYKASMSDSVMSIYLAAKADPDCSAYWIPIPFFERGSDGSFGRMSYEGPEYYPDIECTDWQEYDIAANHPDVIYTFAPYDSGNFVTSVHSDFYCERLRTLTDLLVYVPYFVAVDDVDEHFCTLAGCVFAHKIIVQSEKVRDTYIRIFKKKYGERFGKPEDKFAALGSPKYDAVMGAGREDCELPGKWRELIGEKKIVFFNTSVGSILEGDEQYLIKLRSIISVFRERGDIVLWWRPHPLSEATYKSMRPRILDEYRQIISGYKSGAWGIYDDSADLHRALVWSDAYYGDISSLVRLFQVMEKPVMLREKGLHFSAIITWDASIIDNRILLTNVSDNLFVSVDIDNGDVCPITFVKPKEGYMQYYASFDAGESVYFSPFNAKEIAVYNKSSQTFKYISLETHIADLPEPYFGRIVQYKMKLFFIPVNFPGILELDLESDEYIVHSGWEGQVKSLAFEKSKTIFLRGHPCLTGNKLRVACENANAVLEFNMDDGTWKLERIGKEQFAYANILYDGEAHWLLGRNKAVLVRWDGADSRIIDLPYVTGKEAYAYGWFFSVGKHLWLIPAAADKILKIDKTSCTIEDDSILQDYISEISDVDASKFTCALVHGEKLVLLPFVRNSIFFIDTEDDSASELALRLSDQISDEMLRSFVQQKNMLVEGALLSIEKFCDCISKGYFGEIKNEEELIYGSGERIYEYCRKLALAGS